MFIIIIHQYCALQDLAHFCHPSPILDLLSPRVLMHADARHSSLNTTLELHGNLLCYLILLVLEESVALAGRSQFTALEENTSLH